MESLLKEVAAAAEGGSASNDASSSLHPGIAERVNLQGPSSGGQASTGDAPPVPPTPTPEQQQQMLEFLENLQRMQQTDPTEFDKAMSSLMGIPAGAGGEGASIQSKSDSLASMISSIQSLRNGEGNNDNDMPKDINIGQKKPEQHGIYITPEPGFVVKTRKIENDSGGSAKASVGGSGLDKDDEAEKGMKVFMNICEHEQVGPPGMKKRLDANGEEVEGMNVPMSVGAGRYGEDKSGGKCLIYDIIVNKKVLEESKADKSGKYRDFVCQLGMQCLEQKFSLELDRRYKLPKLKYMYALDGKVDQQYIKDRTRSPQIEEVSANSEAASKAAQNRLKQKAQEEKAMQEARRLAEVELIHHFTWVLRSNTGESVGDAILDGPEVGLPSLKNLFSGDSNDYREPLVRLASFGVPDEHYALCLYAEVANAQSLQESDVTLKVNPFRLTLKLPRYKPLSVHLPVSVDPTGVTCVLSRREGYTGLVDLRIVMPMDTSDWASESDPGSKAWLMEAALSSDEGHGQICSPDVDANEDETNPYSISRKSNGLNNGDEYKGNDNSKLQKDSESSALEDMYHLRPNRDGQVGANNERGLLHADEDTEELPEDKFHRADASSSYYIQQREQAVKDKWDKADKEREERKKNPDPNVEYIDMDDFKPGGKMDKDKDKRGGDDEANGANPSSGSEYGVAAGSVQSGAASETLQKASEVVAEHAGQTLQGLSLSSSTWTELLD